MDLTLTNINKFETAIAGIELPHPIMNGAGTCKLVEEVETFARTAISAIMVGSITVEERGGGTGETYRANKLLSLNSLELPNPGIAYYRRYLPLMAAMVRNLNKFLFVSVAGFNPEEYSFLADLALQGGADLVELNAGCSNVWEDDQQKRIPGFDPRLLAKILQCVEDKVGREAKIAIKLPPFSDPHTLKEIAQVISQSKMVKAVTSTNTFPNALAFNEKGEPWIASRGGLAALGGPALKPIALGQIKQLRDVLPYRIDIIGAGGVTVGQDVVDFQRAGGAKAVQIVTAVLNKNPRKVFDRLLIEFVKAVEELNRYPS